jgi:hypothetical protein
MGPDGIPIEVWRYLGVRAIVWLTKLCNLIFRSNKMPEEWRRSILVPIFKNKGDVQSCTNYRGIKLMSHTMKLWKRVIEHRLYVSPCFSSLLGFISSLPELAWDKRLCCCCCIYIHTHTFRIQNFVLVSLLTENFQQPCIYL